MKDRTDTKAEVICGYLSSENRKKLWVVELDMLEYLERACRELHINYFLLFGSALGAVRHHGFIPWDDDIDLGMLREDFEKFLPVCKKYFPSYIDIQYGVLEDRAEFLMRIRDSRTTGIIRGEEKSKQSKGVFIEVYIFDSIPDDKKRCSRQMMISKLLCSSLAMINTPNDRSLKGLVRKIPLMLLGKKRVWKMYEKNCRRYNGQNRKYVNLVSLPKYGRQQRFIVERDHVTDFEYVDFEYMKARIPSGNDQYLSKLYGNYMELPPIEKRGLYHDNLVYYDPNKSYNEYEKSDLPKRYFQGDSTLMLL